MPRPLCSIASMLSAVGDVAVAGPPAQVLALRHQTPADRGGRSTAASPLRVTIRRSILVRSRRRIRPQVLRPTAPGPPRGRSAPAGQDRPGTPQARYPVIRSQDGET